MIPRIIKNLLIAFILLFNSFVYSQKIKNIIIEGNVNFSRDNYLKWLEIENNINNFSGLEDTILVKIKRNLSNQGYFSSSVDSVIIDTTESTLEIFISEGEPTYLNNISVVTFDSTESIKLRNKFKYITGSIFNKYKIESVISDILTEYENNSYPFATITTKSIYFYKDTTKGKNYADIHFILNKGHSSRIDRFIISGNTSTNENVIIRATRIDSGEIYSQKKIESIPQKLNHLKFFDPIEKPQYFVNSKNEGVLQIKVKEKQTNNFDGIIGYNPESGANRSGYFTGFLNINLRNLFGTGRAAAFKWQKLDRSSQILDLKYLEPWLFDFPINLQLGIFQRKQDSTYIQRKFNFELDYLATTNLSGAFIFSTESTIPSLQERNQFTVFNSSTITTGLNFKYDSRDDFYAPTKGILFQSKYSFSNKKISGPPQFVTERTKINSTLQRLELDFSFFYRIFRNNIFAISLFARELRADSFELSELYRLGGANTLRGYIEDQFLGNRIFWSNLEYRVLMEERSFAFIFLDSGYFFRSADKIQNITENSAWKLGYGFGLNLETSFGILRIGYALGQGDSFSQGKIYFGLLNDF